jgi:hypothetical protein
MNGNLVKNTMVKSDPMPTMSGLVRDTTSGKVMGKLEGFVAKTTPEPKTSPNIFPAGKAPATKNRPSQFGSTPYAGAIPKMTM